MNYKTSCTYGKIDLFFLFLFCLTVKYGSVLGSGSTRIRNHPFSQIYREKKQKKKHLNYICKNIFCLLFYLFPGMYLFRHSLDEGNYIISCPPPHLAFFRHFPTQRRCITQRQTDKDRERARTGEKHRERECKRERQRGRVRYRGIQRESARERETRRGQERTNEEKEGKRISEEEERKGRNMTAKNRESERKAERECEIDR